MQEPDSNISVNSIFSLGQLLQNRSGASSSLASSSGWQLPLRFSRDARSGVASFVSANSLFSPLPTHLSSLGILPPSPQRRSRCAVTASRKESMMHLCVQESRLKSVYLAQQVHCDSVKEGEYHAS